MPRVTEPLREEHKELLPHVEALREAGDAVSGKDDATLKRKISEAYSFLADHLIPHAVAEDRALYPVVGQTMGSEMATRTMSRDHVEVGRLTEQLKQSRQRMETAPLDEATRNELRQILYGLYILVKVHFAKEEEIYLPLLDERLAEAAAHRMFEAMEEAAEAEKSSRLP